MAVSRISALSRHVMGVPSKLPMPVFCSQSCRRMQSTHGGAPRLIAVVCPAGAPALDFMPKANPSVDFIIGNDLSDFANRFGDIDSIMFVATGGNPALLTPLFDSCPNIKWVHSLFAGVDAMAPFINNRLAKSEVLLSNGRGAFSESLAEYVMAAALHFNKRIATCQFNRTEKHWDKFVMPVLKGKTIGFVGFGHIGQTTAKLAKAFGMKTIALRRDATKPSNDIADVVYDFKQKRMLFEEADFVVSALPGTPETINFIGAREFELMKPSAVFISVGRGTVVDETALAAALKSKSISGAALDVFKVEPLPQASPLWECENLLLTAHNADFTEDYFQLGWGIWEKNFASLSSGGALLTPVDKSAGY